jgi:probable addiction module antidote protein
MNKASKPYKELLIESLKDPEQAVAYLNAALEEDEGKKESYEVFLMALRNVAEAWGFSHLANISDLDRSGIYKMLSQKGNPRISSLKSLLDSMGLRLTIALKNDKAAA